jgi:hypothetical protein
LLTHSIISDKSAPDMGAFSGEGGFTSGRNHFASLSIRRSASDPDAADIGWESGIFLTGLTG